MSNREILFRGKFGNEWKYGYLSPEPKGLTIKEPYVCGTSHIWHIDENTLGQFTGLTDINGTKIFEGDIVAFEDATSTENGYYERICYGEVVWDNETVRFEVTNRLSAESDEVLWECKIIGNIHDNPELLEESEQE